MKATLLLTTLLAVTVNVNAKDTFPTELATFHDNTIPSESLRPLLQEIKHFAALGDIHNPGKMKFGKQSTNWLAIPGKGDLPVPRNHIEAQVLKLLDFAKPETMYGEDTGFNTAHYGVLTRYDRGDIKGAEWWIQKRSGYEGIGFHYDKDEAYASNHMTMSYPILSTITYLTDSGAPTLIVNQTSLDGNVEVPEIPEHGVLSFPKQGRHVIFRGDLNHGVAKTVSLDSVNDERITLLVNWWGEKPMEPNCMVLGDKQAKKLKLHYPNDVSAIEKKNVKNKAAKKDVVVNQADLKTQHLIIDDSDGKSYTSHSDFFPPKDMFIFDLPSDLKAKTMYSLEWGFSNVFANVGLLDLQNTNQVSSLFRDKRYKAILFVKGGDDYDGSTDIFPRKDLWFQNWAKQNEDTFKCFIGTKADASNAWKQFGLAESDLPTVVIHDNHANQITTLKNMGVSGVGAQKMEGLVKEFYKVKRGGGREF